MAEQKSTRAAASWVEYGVSTSGDAKRRGEPDWTSEPLTTLEDAHSALERQGSIRDYVIVERTVTATEWRLSIDAYREAGHD